MNEVLLTNEANKSLEKLKKSNPKQHLKIIEFLCILENTENPKALPNAKILKGQKTDLNNLQKTINIY